jgi:hypothetical protein
MGTELSAMRYIEPLYSPRQLQPASPIELQGDCRQKWREQGR